MNCCSQDISNIITVRSSKHGLSIEDNEHITWLKYRKMFFLCVLGFFSSYCALQIWTLKTCNKYISIIIAARSFKLGQLIEYND